MAEKDIKIIITGKDRASKAIKSVSGALKRFGNFAKGVVVAGATAAATAIGGLSVAAINLAKDAASFVTVQESFKSMTNEMGVGFDSMLSSLKEASSGMLSNQELMTSFNEAATLVSKDFAQNLPDAMSLLQKQAAATGKDFSFMLDSFVTGIGRASPKILDNMGITVSVAKVYEQWADSMGMTTDEMTESQKQTALYEAAIESLKKQTSDMNGLQGTAQQQFKMLTATFKNLKTQLGAALLPAFKAIVPVVQNMLSTIGPKVVEFVKTSLVPTIKTLVKFIKILTQQGLKSNKFWDLFASVFGQKAANIFQKIINKISEFVNKHIKPFVEKHGPALRNALLAIGAAIVIVGVIALIIGVLSGITPVILLIIVAVGLLAAAWTENWGGIRQKLKDAWNTIFPILKDVWKWLKVNIPKAIESVTNWWNNKFLPAMKEAGEWIDQHLKPFLVALGKVMIRLGRKGIKFIAGLWNNVLKPAFQDIWSWIKDKLTPQVEGLSGGFFSVADAIEAATGWLESLNEGLKDLDLSNIFPFIESSPAPLEKGLRGISSALAEMSRIYLPEFDRQLAGFRSGGFLANIRNDTRSGKTAGGDTTWNIHYQGSPRSERSVRDDIQALQLMGA